MWNHYVHFNKRNIKRKAFERKKKIQILTPNKDINGMPKNYQELRSRHPTLQKHYPNVNFRKRVTYICIWTKCLTKWSWKGVTTSTNKTFNLHNYCLLVSKWHSLCSSGTYFQMTQSLLHWNPLQITSNESQ